jgi:multiple sugar transport system permease protein
VSVPSTTTAPATSVAGARKKNRRKAPTGLLGVLSRLGAGGIEPLLFLIPAFILIGGVFFAPLVSAILDSFREVSIFGGESTWVGFANYLRLLEPSFFTTVLRTILWVGCTVAGSVILGMALAVALDKPIPGRTLFRIILVLPWIFPSSIVGLMWRFTLHPHYGTLVNFLKDIGLIGDVNLFTSGFALPTALVISILCSFPFVFLSALAGLQAIPDEVMDAALVDGANAWQRFWYITLGYLKPVLWTAAIILAAWTMVSFDLVFVLTGGGPGDETELLAIAVYRTGFLDFQVGMASAIATVTVLLVMGFGYFYVRNTTREAS